MKKYFKIFITIIFFTLFFLVNNVSAATNLKIGEKCYDNSQCKSGDCEDGFCDCDDASDCSQEYDGQTKDWTCENEDSNSFGLDYCKKTDGTKKYPRVYGLAIGEICYNNSNCVSDDCEKSDQKSTKENDPDWYPDRDEVWYCDCSKNSDCAQAYGSGTWECKDGANLSYDIDYCRDKNTGTIKLPFDGNNSTGFWGNLSDVVFDSEAYVKNFGENFEENLVKPQPQINIPGLEFSDINAKNNLQVDDNGDTYLTIPFLGEYIVGIYKYLIVAAVIVAIIIIIISGIQWILSAGNSDTISSIKKRIFGAIIGIVLIFSSYTILYIINPYLTQFKDLKILYVKQTIYDAQEENENVNLTDLQKSSVPLSTKKIEIITPTTTYKTFDCTKWKKDRLNVYKPVGVLPSQYTETYTCENIKDLKNNNLISITTIPEMKIPLCQAATNAARLGYKLLVTDSYRSFEEQADLWCGKGAARFPDEAERKKYYAVPGFSIHGLGQAVDVFLYDKSGNRLTFFGGEQCNSSPEDVARLANIFYNTSDYFYRLETEIWHFEYTDGPLNNSRLRTTSLPTKCTKTK